MTVERDRLNRHSRVGIVKTKLGRGDCHRKEGKKKLHLLLSHKPRSIDTSAFGESRL